MPNLLIVSNEVLTSKMSGTAIRSLEFAKIARQYSKVIVSVPSVDPSFECDFSLVVEGSFEFNSVVDTSDYIIVQGFGLSRQPKIATSSAVIIADMYCPILLEYIQSSIHTDISRRLELVNAIVDSQNDLLVCADYYICASNVQRDFWLGWLSGIKKVNPKRFAHIDDYKTDNILKIIPFGAPERIPAERFTGILRKKFGLKDTDFVMIWGGGVYEWFDPQTIIKAVSTLVKQDILVHLVFLGVKHPNPDVPEHKVLQEALDLCKELGVLDKYVHFNFSWVDYEERDLYLRDANIAVSAHHESIETNYAFRTRILDYIWCELPMISTEGDYFASVIRDEGFGIVANYDDEHSWINAISKLYKDPKFYASCVRRLESCSFRFKWSNSSLKIQQLLTSPKVHDRTLAQTQDGKSAKNIFSVSFIKRAAAYYRSYGSKRFIYAVFLKIRSKIL